MGKAAMQILIEAMDNKKMTKQLFLDSKIIIKKSCGEI
jgi:hypothetical protein